MKDRHLPFRETVDFNHFFLATQAALLDNGLVDSPALEQAVLAADCRDIAEYHWDA